MRETVLAFWHRGEDGLWHQHRLDRERRQAADKTEAARASAQARWLKHKEIASADAARAHAGRTARQNQSHIQSHSHHETAAGDRARAPMAARAPLRLSGADGIWKLRLLAHQPGGGWNPAFGPAPESGNDNPRLDPARAENGACTGGSIPNGRRSPDARFAAPPRSCPCGSVACDADRTAGRQAVPDSRGDHGPHDAAAPAGVVVRRAHARARPDRDRGTRLVHSAPAAHAGVLRRLDRLDGASRSPTSW